MSKLAVFDFDSTLMDGETIDILANAYGVGKEVAAITEKTMCGDLDFFESLIKRVSVLRGMPLTEVKSLCASLPLMKGAHQTISWLKENGYIVVVFSGGFSLATSHACHQLGIDADFANTLHHKDGFLTGMVGGEMMFSHSKGQMLVKIQNILNISKAETLVVGDGANDLSMFQYACRCVAFCAKPVLKSEATYCIDSKDLSLLIPYLKS